MPSQTLIKHSAIAALGYMPNPMRAIWNNATLRDRSFIARAAALGDQSLENEHQVIVQRVYGLLWDELSHKQQVSIHEACRRIASWSDKIGITAEFERRAA